MLEDVRFWRSKERHTLSADRGDMDADTRAEFVNGLRLYGILDKRRVILYEGKVIDGWQFYQCCIEADVRPEFETLKLPKGMTVDEWVSFKNDVRRHETAKAANARIEARREKVATMRAEGKSLRTIAEETGESKSTVERDLQVSHTEENGTPETAENTVDSQSEEGEKDTPEDETSKNTAKEADEKDTPDSPPATSPKKVTGKDKKQYDASKKKLCASCARQKRVSPSEPLPKNCEQCKELNKGKGGKKPSSNGKVIFDDRKIQDAIGKLARLFNDRAEAHDQQKAKEYTDVRGCMEKLISSWDRWQVKQEKK